jgi:hypothetical protein
MTIDIRIMSVRQPHAWAIIHGGKTVENRRQNIAGAYRGPVAVHAAKTGDERGWAAALARRAPWDYVAWMVRTPDRRDAPTGVIIGVVDLVDVHWGCPEGIVADWPMCSRWAEGPGEEFWHLELRNPRPLPEPIVWKGALGMRRLDPAMVPGLTNIL